MRSTIRRAVTTTGLAIGLLTATPVHAQVQPPEKMCIFPVAGQSNAMGFGERYGPIVPNTAWAYPLTAQLYSNDPIPPNQGGGSMWPAFVTEFEHQTGLRTLTVIASSFGGFQSNAAWSQGGSPTNVWSFDVGGQGVPAIFTAVDAALQWALQSGYDAKICGVNWSQGESEGNGIGTPGSGIVKQTYKGPLQTMIGALRTHYGATMPFYIFRTGSLSSALLTYGASLGNDYEAGYKAVRDAQEETAHEIPYVLIATRIALTCAARNLLILDSNGRGVHYNQDCNNAMGRDAAQRIVASGLWNRW